MQTLMDLFGERFWPNPSMRDLTTVRIGGPAPALVIARTQEELTTAIRITREEGIRFLLLGGGSNLLVADEGLDLLVVKNEVSALRREGNTVWVSGGTVLQDLVGFTLRSGLAGLQKLTGIPGTVGGAIYGNAGAYGQTISDHLQEVLCFDGRQIVSYSKPDCRFSYRWSAFKENRCVVLEARLELEPGDAQALVSEAESVLRQRLLKYPAGLKCSGSFFKNVLADQVARESLELIPPDKVIYGKIPAGYLLEQTGAKDRTLGDIWVSTASANLFVNRGNGRAADLLQLAADCASRVKDRYGIQLQPEVQIINLPSPFVSR